MLTKTLISQTLNVWFIHLHSLSKKKVQKTKRRGQSPRGRSLSLGGLVGFVFQRRFRGGFLLGAFWGSLLPTLAQIPLRI